LECPRRSKAPKARIAISPDDVGVVKGDPHVGPFVRHARKVKRACAEHPGICGYLVEGGLAKRRPRAGGRQRIQ
jgi:hypothetical protein